MSAPTRAFDSRVNWIGPHSAIRLSRVLKRIAHEEKSGDLQVTFGKSTKTLFLKKGSVVFAASNILQDRLGETMLERGTISEYEFVLASSLMQTEGRRFGESLVRIGLITREELQRQLLHQFNRIASSLFTLRDGIYSFEERPPAIPDDLTVELPVPHILLDGLRRVPDDRLLLACLPPPQFKLRATPRAFEDFDVNALTPEELSVLRVADEGATLGTILSEVAGDTRHVLRLCGAFSILGLLEAEDDRRDEETLHETVQRSFIQTENMSEHEILEVTPGTEGPAIERAFALKRLEWSKIQERIAGDADLEQRVFEIQFRLAAAYHRLMLDSSSRERANAELGRPGAVTAFPQTEPGPIEEKSSAPASAAVRRTEEQLLGTVKARFEAQDWEGAIPVLIQLVEMAPRNACYRGFLAKAMYKHPTLRKQAEDHFLEAIRLAPHDSNLHMWLGLYYKSFGQAPRAAKAFRTALELNPENRVAKKYLLRSECESLSYADGREDRITC